MRHEGKTPGEQRLIFVLVDGLNAATAESMGYLAALTEGGLARRADMDCELPPLSRPLYDCIFTGRTPCQSGIVHNDAWRVPSAVERAAHPSIFARASAAGLITAAAAYFFVSELCNESPFDPVRHRLCLRADKPVQNGLFYCRDDYPDAQLLLDAEWLRVQREPHLLLIHSMGVDNAGHVHGADSAQYRQAAREMDMLLARFMPAWLAEGYAVMVTSDHGMSADAAHNDLAPDVRRVPLWLAGKGTAALPLPQRQTQWCEIMCRVLGIKF